MHKILALLLIFTAMSSLARAQVPANPAQADKDAPTKPDERVMHIGGSVTPPVLMHSVAPDSSGIDRSLDVRGGVQVYLWVDENGHPSHVRIIHGVGLGLDEKAVEAVRQYKFKPAMLNGKPVTVDMYVNVNVSTY